MFVAPAPPNEDYISESGESTPKKNSSKNNSTRNSKCGPNKRLLKQTAGEYLVVLRKVERL